MQLDSCDDLMTESASGLPHSSAPSSSLPGDIAGGLGAKCDSGSVRNQVRIFIRAQREVQLPPLLRGTGPLSGVLVVLISLHASPLDTARTQQPQLSTSRARINSDGTIKEAMEGSLDFLLTDMPLTDDELKRVQDLRGVRLLHIATAVTAVVPCYNIVGPKDPLNFSSATLAGIFLGKITKWNDPALVALNPSSHLPATDIVVIGHSMEDGSTYTWTDFLSKTNLLWRQSVGKVRSFATLLGAGGQRAENLAELVQQTPNSMSYMELLVAKGRNLQIGRVKNRSGNFIDPSPTSVRAAALTASQQIRDDFRASITDTSGPLDYPIASFTWIVVPNPFRDSGHRSAVLSFLKWVLTDGQNSPESMHLARLPLTIAQHEIHMIDSLR